MRHSASEFMMHFKQSYITHDIMLEIKQFLNS